MNINGYETVTSFYLDFSVADRLGSAAIKDTFNNAFDKWKHDYKYLTELVMVLNWKMCEHYEKNKSIAKIYSNLWAIADGYACENLKGAELKYFLRTTDVKETEY